MQKPGVCGSHGSAFCFFILFFVFNLERKKKVYGERKKHFGKEGTLVLTSAKATIPEIRLPVIHESRRRLKSCDVYNSNCHYFLVRETTDISLELFAMCCQANEEKNLRC